MLVHPVALFSILDHYLRRTDEQDRVIGTLLGTRTDSDTVEVHTAFAMLHSETSEQVAVDADYLKVMYDLCHKVHPQEVIVGWLVDSSLVSLRVYIGDQVFNWISPQHIFCVNSKFLFTRDGTISSGASCVEYRYRGGRGAWRKGIC